MDAVIVTVIIVFILSQIFHKIARMKSLTHYRPTKYFPEKFRTN